MRLTGLDETNWETENKIKKTFLLTLDEDLYGDKMQKTTDKLFDMNIPATIFIDHKTSMSHLYIERLKTQGFDLQMHWVRFPRRKFFWKTEPSFTKQKEELESKLDEQIIGNRTHGLEWKAPIPRGSCLDFVYPWYIMDGNGIEFSSSTYGFPHPFRPKRIDGEMFNLVEIPITHYETFPSNTALVVGLYHPHYYAWVASVGFGHGSGFVFKTMSQFVEELKI